MNNNDHGEGTKRLQLVRPKSPNSGMYKTAFAFVAMSLLVSWCTMQGGTAPTAQSVDAQTVIDLTRKMSPPVPATSSSAAPSTQDAAKAGWTVANVAVDFSVPTGWESQASANQIFLTAPSTGRVCQITASNNFDTAEFSATSKGKEAEVEAQMLQELLSSGAELAGGKPTIDVSVELLSVEREEDRLRYVATATATMLFPGGSRKWINVTAVVASGHRMARMQCADMQSDMDTDQTMTVAVQSLQLL